MHLVEKSVSDNGLRPRWPWLLCLSCALLLIVGFLILRHRHEPVFQASAASGESAPPDLPAPTPAIGSSHRPRNQEHRADTPKLAAEEIVAGKVAQFGNKRRELVRAIAQRSQKSI